MNSRDHSTTPLISIVTPVYNESENIGPFIIHLNEQLKALPIHYEILIIDDGSTDQTIESISQAAQDIPCKVIQLSRNFGKEIALTAGLQAASGDAVIMIDSDFQHPLDLIPQMIAYWKEGFDMVYGVRANRSTLMRYLSKLFYKLLAQSSPTPIVPDAGDFRLLDRKVVNALNALPERTRFMKGLYSWVGFKSMAIPFQVAPRASGESSFKLRGLIRLAITGFTSFSNLPLRIWVVIGILISFLSLCYALIILAQTLIYGVDIPGWATLTIIMLFLGGIQLLSIGILGEYISRIFLEVKRRPHFIVSQVHDFSNKP